MQKNEWVAQTKESDTILRSMNACFILINSDLVVIRTNYYDLSGISEEPASSGRVGDLLNCKNAVRSGGGCGCSVRIINRLFLVMFLSRVLT